MQKLKRNEKKLIKDSHGFTLIELIFVICTAGILAGIAVPIYYHHIEKAKITKAISEIRVIEKEVMAFQIANQNAAFPDTLDRVGRNNVLDPWKNLYRYFNIEASTGNGERRNDGVGNFLNNDFDLYCIGKDGNSSPSSTEAQSRDDIIRANNGQLVVLGSEL